MAWPGEPPGEAGEQASATGSLQGQTASRARQRQRVHPGSPRCLPRAGTPPSPPSLSFLLRSFSPAIYFSVRKECGEFTTGRWPSLSLPGLFSEREAAQTDGGGGEGEGGAGSGPNPGPAGGALMYPPRGPGPVARCRWSPGGRCVRSTAPVELSLEYPIHRPTPGQPNGSVPLQGAFLRSWVVERSGVRIALSLPAPLGLALVLGMPPQLYLSRS